MSQEREFHIKPAGIAQGSVLGLLLLLAFFGGAGTVCIKVAVREMPPFYFCFLRFSLAFVLLLPLGRIASGAPRGPAPVQRSWRPGAVLILGAGLNFGNVALFVLGIPHTDAALSQLLYVVAPLIVCVVGVAARVESLTVPRALGLVMGVSGAALAVMEQHGVGVRTDGLLYIMLAVLCYSGYILAARRLHRSWSSAQQTLTMSAIVAIGTLVLSLACAEHWPSPRTLSSEALLGLLGSAILGSAGYYYLAMTLVRRASPTVASYALLLQPFTAYLASAPFFESHLSVAAGAGTLLTVVGAYLVVQRHSNPVAENAGLLPRATDS